MLFRNAIMRVRQAQKGKLEKKEPNREQALGRSK